ncbi:mitotic-spindle organizing protein 1-like [Bacillus rossius redtenbacheri]|uniref:mitotic-spindle organizing protein 1-like n=1 Tax=Bacillus rossius redtenbacheri TaxID=93214 RepID=UPI002FDD8F8E
MPECGGQPELQKSQLLEAKEAFQKLTEISALLNTGLSPEVLAHCVRLCEAGVNPEVLAQILLEIRKELSAIGSGYDAPE